MTTEKLSEWMAQPLGDLDLWAVFIDGIHFGEHVILCALGIDATGAKHVLGLGRRDRERDRVQDDAREPLGPRPETEPLAAVSAPATERRRMTKSEGLIASLRR